MIIVLGVAAGAALAVLIYERVRQRDPELATASLGRVHQLAAVVVVLTSAIDKLFEALAAGTQPLYASYGKRTSWRDDRDWDDA